MTRSPLFLPGWIEFTRRLSGLEPMIVRYAKEGRPLPAVDAVLYLDKRGRVAQPHANSYIPVQFTSTPTRHSARIYRQWLEAAELLLDELRARGMRHPIALPPEIDDVRVWQWRGFRTDVRYTFYLDFPLDPKEMDSSKIGNINRASARGFRCTQVEGLTDVFECLVDTEARQSFSHRLTPQHLALAADLVPAENLRAYVCYSPEGEPACASVVLHVPGGRSLGWLHGTKAAFMKSEATPLLDTYVFNELHKAGATGLDMAGANLPSVANYKSQLGGRLVPYFRVEPPALKALMLDAAEYVRFRRLWA